MHPNHVASPSKILKPIDSLSLPYIHPSLTVGAHPAKGRLVNVTTSIKDGEVVMVDTPYVLVPAMLVDKPPFFICSRQHCNRRVPIQASKVSCVCIDEVAWCSDECRSRDRVRHIMECAWLKQTSSDIRASHGDSIFGILWMIARILINKQCDYNDKLKNLSNGQVSNSHFGRRGWEAVWNLDGELRYFPDEQIAQWRMLVDKFLLHKSLGFDFTAENILRLICKVETNSFGLYPGATGEYPVVSFVSRGDYYGGGIYPTAAMFNHSCCPNITHEVDRLGRRVFRAGRDLVPGEECCISYFDLFEYPDSVSRKETIRDSWDFTCTCQRCEDEGEYDLPHYLKEMNFE